MASEIFVWTYDLFLSFRGEDTRNSFTGHLYEALLQAGINTFMDTEELNRGMEISQELCDAIDKSRFFLVVFSKNYASSTWCLNELVRIMSCIESGKGQMVWPVFYDVDPSQVRKQTGIFGEAFTLHEERFKQNLEKVEKWREALTKAANLSGRDLDKGSEATLVKEIVREIWTELNRTLLTVAKNPVGIHYHIEKLESSLCLESNDVRMIGIYGLGGIGKTTIAKAVYNLIVDRFEGCSFLPNIKEKCNSSLHDGLVELQNLLPQDIFLDKRRLINFVDRGTCILKDRLRSKKVLIVLDDVDNVFHLEKLAGNANWFGLGSRVIITTRNMQLLSAHGIDWTYRVDGLNYKDSLELFCWNAFNKPHPVENFDELSNIAVRYAAGLPLALIVVGASLCGYEEAAWESQLKKLEKIPNKDVHEILKLSFDGLEDHEKKIFLDIACFFRGFNSKEHIMSFFYSCGFYPESGIAVLVKKCLIFIEKGRFEMHDLIQSMGREIVRQESQHPGERSRLWYHEDIIQVLTENEGICNEKKIVFKVPGNKIPNSFQCPPSLPLSLHGKKHVVGIVLCLLLLHDDTSMGISIKIQINGLAVHKDFVFRSFSEDLWICYLPRNSSEVLDQLLKGNPSHFDVTFLEEGMGEKRTFLAEKIGVGLIFDEEAYISCGKKRKRIRIYGKKRKRI